MVRVRTSSRLHFGLLSLAGQQGEAVVPARRFGGVGLMVERPGLQVRATAAAAWSAEGPLAERALAFARCFADGLRGSEAGRPRPPQRLTVEGAAPEPAGLGTGTQR